MMLRKRRYVRAAAIGVACGLWLVAPATGEDGPPDVIHQAAYCTIPDRAIALCAAVTDDSRVAKVRAYFRRAGTRDFSFVEMESEGDEYCGTLPAPREGKMEELEYYIQAIDDSYDSKRTARTILEVQEPEVCGFPPVQENPQRASAITVYATQRGQKKLDKGFVAGGVTFVTKR